MPLLRSINSLGRRGAGPAVSAQAPGSAELVARSNALVPPPAFLDDVFRGLPGVDAQASAHLGSVQRGEVSLGPSDLLKLLDETLLELEPAQLTELHRNLVEAARSVGAYAVPRTRVSGVPATVKDIVAILTGETSVPTHLDDVRWALADVRQTLERVERSRLALMGSNGVDASLNEPRLTLPAVEAHARLLRDREEELLHYETLIKAGVPLSRPEPWPTDVRSARKQRQKIARELMGLEARLRSAERRGAPETVRNALRRHLDALQQRRDDLAEIFEGLQGIAQRDFLDSNSYTVGMSVGPGIPGMFAVTRDIGVRVLPADRRTGERDVDVYRGFNVSTPVASAGYVKSKEVDGFNASVSLPYFSLFNSQLHGRGARLFIPGAFSFSFSDRGNLGLWVGLPCPIPGFVMGLTLNARNPKFATVTGPPVRAIENAWEWTQHAAHLGDPQKRGRDIFEFPSYSSAKPRATGPDANRGPRPPPAPPVPVVDEPEPLHPLVEKLLALP